MPSGFQIEIKQVSIFVFFFFGDVVFWFLSDLTLLGAPFTTIDNDLSVIFERSLCYQLRRILQTETTQLQLNAISVDFYKDLYYRRRMAYMLLSIVVCGVRCATWRLFASPAEQFDVIIVLRVIIHRIIIFLNKTCFLPLLWTNKFW